MVNKWIINLNRSYNRVLLIIDFAYFPTLVLSLAFCFIQDSKARQGKVGLWRVVTSRRRRRPPLLPTLVFWYPFPLTLISCCQNSAGFPSKLRVISDKSLLESVQMDFWNMKKRGNYENVNVLWYLGKLRVRVCRTFKWFLRRENKLPFGCLVDYCHIKRVVVGLYHNIHVGLHPSLLLVNLMILY